MSRGIHQRSLLLALLSVLLLSCSAPSLLSRVVGQDSASFVRLDSFQNTSRSSIPYDHPARWSGEDLAAVLGRLLLEDRVGIMDKARPPRPVFSSDDLAFLVPASREAFDQATPREWVAFALSTSLSSGSTITSGGMFVVGGRLHIVLANHHAPVGMDAEELARVRANPLYSIKGPGGVLTFESSRFVAGAQANWSGGHKFSASELILDHQAFLSVLKVATTPPPPVAVAAPAPGGAPSPAQDAAKGNIPTRVDLDSQQAIQRLQDEIGKLKKKLEEQEAEIDRLKRRSPSFPRQ